MDFELMGMYTVWYHENHARSIPALARDLKAQGLPDSNFNVYRGSVLHMAGSSFYALAEDRIEYERNIEPFPRVSMIDDLGSCHR